LPFPASAKRSATAMVKYSSMSSTSMKGDLAAANFARHDLTGGHPFGQRETA
jgi:hypothetical protein